METSPSTVRVLLKETSPSTVRVLFMETSPSISTRPTKLLLPTPPIMALAGMELSAMLLAGFHDKSPATYRFLLKETSTIELTLSLLTLNTLVRSCLFRSCLYVAEYWVVGNESI